MARLSFVDVERVGGHSTETVSRDQLQTSFWPVLNEPPGDEAMHLVISTLYLKQC